MKLRYTIYKNTPVFSLRAAARMRISQKRVEVGHAIPAHVRQLFSITTFPFLCGEGALTDKEVAVGVGIPMRHRGAAPHTEYLHSSIKKLLQGTFGLGFLRHFQRIFVETPPSPLPTSKAYNLQRKHLIF